MKIFIFIISIIGVILFIYLNFRLSCKFNLTLEYINTYIEVNILKKKFKFSKKIYYTNVVKIIFNIKHDKTKEKNFEKFKHLLKYRKYFRCFIIKNISFYAECYDDKFSIAIEFYIVNNLLKRSLLNENYLIQN